MLGVVIAFAKLDVLLRVRERVTRKGGSGVGGGRLMRKPSLMAMNGQSCAIFAARKRTPSTSKSMATNRTFTIIKPDATGAGNTGKIIDRIIEAGFTIKAMKWTQLSLADAQAFYAVHSERPFFGELTEYMSSGPIVAAILEKDNAVADFRTLIGATNPAEAAPGTIRADFAESIAANAVHGSDSDENAAIEGSFYFSERELA